jgi:hypothetical protein
VPADRRLLVELHELLVDGPGDCADAGLLLNPTWQQARAALDVAMTQAHESRAVLVAHVLAHGSGRQRDRANRVRHLLHMWDTIAEPLGDDAKSRGWDVYEQIDSGMSYCDGIAGLVLVVDACSASWAKTAIDAWSGVSGGLLSAVLAASGDHQAWDACLTRTVVGALRRGVSAAEHPDRILMPELRATDLTRMATARCRHQTPRISGFQYHDPVLHVGRNPAGDELARQLGLDARTASLILRLTSHYTDFAAASIARVVEENRIVSIVGGAGSGKSTLAAALRWAPQGSSIPVGLIDAAAFVSPTPGITDLAHSLAGQLCELPAFAQATQRFRRENDYRLDSLDDWQRELIEPLTDLRRPVRLLIDGIDQLAETDREELLRELRRLRENDRIQLVLTSRTDPGLAESTLVEMPALDDETARRYLRSRGVDADRHDQLLALAGDRWLVLDLAASQSGDADSLDALYTDLIDRARTRHGPLVDEVLALLAAAGTGPVLPVRIVEAALDGRPNRAILTILGDEDLYRVIDRVAPGTGGDHVGLFHQTLVDHLAADLTATHLAIAEALDRLAPDHDPRDFRDDPVHAYAFEAQPAHWWGAGRADGVVASLEARTDVLPGVNLGRWLQWSDRVRDALGPDHPASFAMRNNIAA